LAEDVRLMTEKKLTEKKDSITVKMRLQGVLLGFDDGMPVAKVLFNNSEADDEGVLSREDAMLLQHIADDKGFVNLEVISRK
jgi:hypothetical protein